MNDDRVAKVREVLKLWDDGILTRGEFAGLLDDMTLKPLFAALEKGETWRVFGSCCCSSHTPDRTFKVEITIEPHGFTAKPFVDEGCEECNAVAQALAKE